MRACRAVPLDLLRHSLLAFAAVALPCLGGPAFADDPPGKTPQPAQEQPKDPKDDPKAENGARAPAPEEASKGTKPEKADPAAKKGPAAADKAAADKSTTDRQESRLERTKRLVRELEISVASARAAQPVDEELVRALEKSLEIAKSLAKPITLAELSEEERRGVVDEVKKQLEPAGLPDKNPAVDVLKTWEENAVAKAFDGADLGEEEQTRARGIISEWFSATGPARLEADWKRVNDLKRDRDDKLVQALGKKKAQRVINNLNAMSGWGPGRR